MGIVPDYRIFFKAYGPDEKVKGSGYAHRGYRDCLNPVYAGMTEVLSDMMKSPTYTRIKFVRCPYRRAVSSYLYSMGKEMQVLLREYAHFDQIFPISGKKEPIYMSLLVPDCTR